LAHEHGVTWGLTATGGRASFSCRVERVDGMVLDHSVALVYGDDGLGESAGETYVRAVAIERAGLVELRETLVAHLARSLAELRLRDFTCVAQLTNPEMGASLRLSFGEQPDLILGSDGIGCLLEARTGLFEARMKFRTDLTCIQILADGIELALETPQGLRAR
jgi:hypothetical protein